nr:PD-(D/E)XK nuclease family protein [Synergistaceae bacterium]
LELSRGVVLTGIIDAWAEEAGHIHIWDYKIGRQGRVPPEIYEEQLRFYGYAMHRAFPERSLSLELLLLSEEKVLPVSPPESWEKMEGVLQEAARQGERGPFSEASEKCASCPWREGFCRGSAEK